MTYADYVGFAESYRRCHPEQRTGQVYFNVLASLRQWAYIAENVRGGLLDPFYNDDRIPDFLDYVRERMV